MSQSNDITRYGSHHRTCGFPSARRTKLEARIAALQPLSVGTTIITVEEQMRGWLASIAKEKTALRWVNPYSELRRLFDFFSNYQIAPFDTRAVDLFVTYSRIRIGSADRKIAAIAIVNRATLFTANRYDFEKIPGLTFENAMD